MELIVDKPIHPVENVRLTLSHSQEVCTMQQETPNTTRRDFLKTSVAAGGVLAAGGLMNVHADGPEIIRVGLIGCGGRGSGAVEQCLRAGALASPQVNVRLVALGDAFRDRATGLRNRLRGAEGLRDKVDVPDD